MVRETHWELQGFEPVLPLPSQRRSRRAGVVLYNHACTPSVISRSSCSWHASDGALTSQKPSEEVKDKSLACVDKFSPDKFSIKGRCLRALKVSPLQSLDPALPGESLHAAALVLPEGYCCNVCHLEMKRALGGSSFTFS